MMQTEGTEPVEAGRGEPVEAEGVSDLTQQDQALEEEIERLLEENDELKV